MSLSLITSQLLRQMALTTDYFKDLVKTETKKLNELCEQWNRLMDNERDITEEGLSQLS